MIRVVSWNTAGRDWWSACDRDVDVLLLQEARRPPSAPNFQMVPSIDDEWRTAGSAGRSWGTAIAAPSGRVGLRPHPLAGESDPAPDALLVSLAGTLRVADILRDGQIVVTVASMYAAWQTARRGRAIYADASAHRLLSDLSALISARKNHRIVAAGDLNILRGYGEHGNAYWRGRYATVFDRGRPSCPPTASMCRRTTPTAKPPRRPLGSSTSYSPPSPSPTRSQRPRAMP
jgi:hypothetical protein